MHICYINCSWQFESYGTFRIFTEEDKQIKQVKNPKSPSNNDRNLYNNLKPLQMISERN